MIVKRGPPWVGFLVGSVIIRFVCRLVFLLPHPHQSHIHPKLTSVGKRCHEVTGFEI